MARRVQRKPFLETEINVLSPADLLVCKVLFDRPKDGPGEEPQSER